MNIEFFMAARARVVYEGRQTLAGAILAKPDDDQLVQAVEDVFAYYYGNRTMSVLDAIEHQIAKLADEGQEVPISNEEAYTAARWVMQEGLVNLPNPMPRGFVLYFAKAMKDQGQADTMENALDEILTTKQFV